MEQITLDEWSPELGYFPKKDVVNKETEITIDGKYTEKDGKRTVYKIITFSEYGNRQLQVNSAQAIEIGKLIFPTKAFVKSFPNGEYKGKKCYTLQMKFTTSEKWI